jgi:hypothetical protein
LAERCLPAELETAVGDYPCVLASVYRFRGGPEQQG